MAPITDDNCRTDPMRAMTSLRRSVMARRPDADERPHRLDKFCAHDVVAFAARHHRRDRVGRERVELRRDPGARVRHGGDRRGVEDAVGKRREQSHLIDEAERREARLREQRANALAARDRRLDPRIGDAAEAGEHLELEELRIVEPQAPRGRAQGRRLRLAADATDGEADVHRGPLVGGEKARIEHDLPVGDRDEVRGNEGREVAGVGLGDRQRGQRPSAKLGRELRRAFE